MKNKNQTVGILVVVAVIILFLAFIPVSKSIFSFVQKQLKGSGTIRLLSSRDNMDLEEEIQKYARENGFKVEFTYLGDLEITEELNANPDAYDAVWLSNSLWLYMVEDSKLTSESKSISISPVVMGIRRSKAEQLGFVGRDVTNREIVDKIRTKELKFIMGNVNKTNDGASSFLGFSMALAGNPNVLTEEMFNDDAFVDELIALFDGVERTSASDEFLEKMFYDGNYDAMIASESNLIKINKELERKGDKDLLYFIYPTDGVPINDSTLAFIDHYDNPKMKDNYLLLQRYLRSSEGQKKLEELGRRTWYGGINSKANSSYFNKDWGINTNEYLTGTKFPSRKVITKALDVYIEEIRKPSHTVFCLDYSGSMSGNGIAELRNAMRNILDYETARKDKIQFSKRYKVTILPFSDRILGVKTTLNGTDTDKLISDIDNRYPTGGTAIYGCASEAINILEKEDPKYGRTVILMTDGANNVSNFTEFKRFYGNKNIPVYSITFGDARENQLREIADLTNAKVFDGKNGLLKAFREVRSYN
jgi:Ca-activated chloride channel family protein